jgi:hypothetical protein
MTGRSNFAPTARTIIVALVLMLIGLLGTYGSLLPDQVGIVAFLLATALLLVGIVVEGV